MTRASAGFLSTGGDERTLTPRSGGGGGGSSPVVHRLALFKDGHISAILSQSDIMSYLAQHAELLGPELARATVDELGFASGRRVVCVTPGTPTHAAFTIMFSHSVSGAWQRGACVSECHLLTSRPSSADITNRRRRRGAAGGAHREPVRVRPAVREACFVCAAVCTRLLTPQRAAACSRATSACLRYPWRSSWRP